MQEKKIVLNALPYRQENSGIGVLIREFFAPYITLTRRYCQIVLPQDSPSFPSERAEKVFCPWKNDQSLRRAVYQSFAMGRLCENSVLLTTDSKIPFFLPKSCTVLPLITDLAVYRMGEVYQRSRTLWWRFQYRYVRRRAEHFLAISEFTKKEMTALLGIPPERIDVIHCACSQDFKCVDDVKKLTAVRQKYDLPEQYLLFVGNTNPRKNLTRILRAYDEAREEGKLTCPLIIAGGQGWKFDRNAVLKGLKHREDIRFLGFVPDDDMSALYCAATVFIFATLYEGFGIPVLEAQTCGVSVLTSNCSSLPEVAGKGALLVNPYSVDEIRDGMVRLMADEKLRERLVMAGFENIRRFSWQTAARQLDEIVEQKVMQ